MQQTHQQPHQTVTSGDIVFSCSSRRLLARSASDGSTLSPPTAAAGDHQVSIISAIIACWGPVSTQLSDGTDVRSTHQQSSADAATNIIRPAEINMNNDYPMTISTSGFMLAPSAAVACRPISPFVQAPHTQEAGLRLSNNTTSTTTTPCLSSPFASQEYLAHNPRQHAHYVPPWASRSPIETSN